MKQIEREFGRYLELGGEWRPKSCMAKNKIAIIIPHRDRLENLKILINNLHVFLQNQQAHYKIYITEPHELLEFNKALIMNAAVKEIMKEEDNNWDCFIFHDVDLLPEYENIIYRCTSDLPLLLCVSTSMNNYS